MATIKTPGLFYPPPPAIGVTLGFTNTTAIDAAGEKIATYGRMWNKDGTAKSIRKVGFRTGTTVIKTGGAQMRCSLQNMSSTVGPPAVPDETQDQTVDFMLTDLSASTWYQTAAFSADRSVAFGELVAVVLEFNTYPGAAASDQLTLSGLTRSGVIGADYGSANTTKTSGTWAVSNATGPVFLLEFSDGTFGSLGMISHLLPVVSSASASGNNIHLTSTPDERANRFLIPFDCYCDGGWVQLALAGATSDFEIILYEGTTARKTVAFDANAVATTGGGAFFASWEPQLMTAGTQWYLAIRPTVSGATITPQSITVADANHFQCQPGGTDIYGVSRSDLAGTWTTATTTRYLAGLSISAIETGGAAGGGLIRHPGMSGGFVA